MIKEHFEFLCGNGIITSSTKMFLALVNKHLKHFLVELFQQVPDLVKTVEVWFAVTIWSDNLKAVTKFCYLGGVLSNDCSINPEIAGRFAKASSNFGHLAKLWDKHDISLVTKVSVYQAAVLTVLLYGAETWTVYC